MEVAVGVELELEEAEERVKVGWVRWLGRSGWWTIKFDFDVNIY